MSKSIVFLLLSLCVVGVFAQDDIRPLSGGITLIDLANAEDFVLEQVNDTAYFAVDQINEKVADGILEFSDHVALVPLELVEILSASSQVTTGITYTLDLQTSDAQGEMHTYNVQVGVQPWLPQPISLVRTRFIE